MKLHQTKMDLPETIRCQAIELLNQSLVDALDLELQARQAHWNVKGPSFIALHELFAKVADELDAFADDIAERVTALGGVALGTVQVVAKQSRVPKYPTELLTCRGHLEALSGNVACFARSARETRGSADDLGDASTADLFTEVARGADKLLWLLEAHLRAREWRSMHIGAPTPSPAPSRR
jgi:starvation-inducible DNA-binding protein